MVSDDPPPATDPSARPPSVDALARSLADTGLPHPLLVDVARDAIAAGDVGGARHRAERVARRLLGPVVNATGVLLHTNLGRAPLATDQAAAYSNLELDLATGERGSRQDHVGWLLARAAGAEAALVVNNGAAAVLLAAAALARGRGIAVSRGELVQLGGGFRLPEVIAESGARLVEVGTTNRTTTADYRTAVAAGASTAGADPSAATGPAPDVAMVLKVHQSNYRIVGFTEAAPVGELAGLGPPLVVDVGSGLLDAGTPWLSGGPPPWLAEEPAVRQTLAAGADLVAFSGDKLLGGPQAGVLAGRADLVAACGRHPLYRAMRPGSHVLAALQTVALAYLDGRAGELPLWQMAGRSTTELAQRAEALATQVDESLGVESAATTAVVGGGSAPGAEIPSWGLVLEGDRRRALRSGEVPVIARVQEGRTTLDLRTVDPDDDRWVAEALRVIASK